MMWIWNDNVQGYCMELTNNSELQMIIDDDKSNPRPVAIWKAWHDFYKNENCFSLFGRYETRSKANKAIRKYLGGK